MTLDGYKVVLILLVFVPLIVAVWAGYRGQR